MESGDLGVTTNSSWTEEVFDINASGNSDAGEDFELHLKKGKCVATPDSSCVGASK